MMGRVNRFEYVERITAGAHGRKTVNGPTYRDWWLIKHNKQIAMGKIVFPPSYIGKKVRIKIEIMEDKRK